MSTFAFLWKSIWSSLHLSEFSLNLSMFDQFRTLSTVACKLLTPNFGTMSETAVSSANFHMANRELSVVVRSFIMTKKSLEPMRVPCGFLAGTAVNSKKQSEPRLTRWDLSRRKSATQLTMVGLTPRLQYRSNVSYDPQARCDSRRALQELRRALQGLHRALQESRRARV